MDGILIIDKHAGLTSHDVVARVRRALRTKRVGHTGTLDPFATGVMVILVGQATRLAQFLDKDEKEYEAVVRFGCETDTGDLTGRPNPETEMPEDEVREKMLGIDWGSVLPGFRGETEQIPPMYSAKKVAGTKLYERARRGEIIERKPVKINISDIELLETVTSEIRIRVVCSAGTYIRTLAEDIGRTVGISAHLVQLRRTRSGRFDISQAISLDKLAVMEDAASALLPIGAAVSHLAKFVIADERVEKTRNGLSTWVGESGFVDGEPVSIEDSHGGLVAIAIYNAGENTVQPKVVLV
jgi:tRNA pseudouridine55 synthase